MTLNSKERTFKTLNGLSLQYFSDMTVSYIQQDQGHAHDYRGAGGQSQKRAVCARHIFFSGLNNTICSLINVKFINKVLIESELLSCVSCVAVSDMQLLLLLCQQIIVNMSLFTLS